MLDREEAKCLYDRYRKQRDGIRNCEGMGSLCLICGSVDVVPKVGEEGMLVCRNCGFVFYRSECTVCGATIDGRDPRNPGCRECGQRLCTCGTCGCNRPQMGRLPTMAG